MNYDQIFPGDVGLASTHLSHLVLTPIEPICYQAAELGGQQASTEKSLTELPMPALPSETFVTGSRSEAFRFLCRCLAAAPNGRPLKELASTARLPAFRWTEFVDLATDQLVAPTVGHRLDQLQLDGAVPEMVRRYFSAMLRLNRSRNVHLRQAAMEIARALNEIDVVPVFLKGGAGLLTGLYNDPGMRLMSDLDILVPKDHGDDSVSRLVALGYSPPDGDRHPRAHNFALLVRPFGPAAVDLHREVLAYPYEGLLPAADVLSKAVEHKSDGATFAVPCPTHQVILNVGHAQLNDHGYTLGHVPLRSLHDLALIMQSKQDQIDWKEIETRLFAAGNRRALDFHLLAARQLLGVEPREGFTPSLSARLLLRRALFMIGHPEGQRMGDRIFRVFLLLKRELSSSDLRARLLRHMGEPAWWRRNVLTFWRGGW